MISNVHIRLSIRFFHYLSYLLTGLGEYLALEKFKCSDKTKFNLSMNSQFQALW